MQSNVTVFRFPFSCKVMLQYSGFLEQYFSYIMAVSFIGGGGYWMWSRNESDITLPENESIKCNIALELKHQLQNFQNSDYFCDLIDKFLYIIIVYIFWTPI
jgi:hypothetical protein